MPSEYYSMSSSGPDKKHRYFAYGSNLNEEQMRSRIKGDFAEPKAGRLRGFKMVFDKYAQSRKCGAANLVCTNNVDDVIEGLIYKLTEVQFQMLDRFEGTHSTRDDRYQRQEVILDNEKVAITYVAVSEVALKGATSHKPSVDYLVNFLKAREKLSEPYYQSLLSIEVQEGGTLGAAPIFSSEGGISSAASTGSKKS